VCCGIVSGSAITEVVVGGEDASYWDPYRGVYAVALAIMVWFPRF